ncbi:MAG TPA: TrbI/VirB10 family protein [Allosphingosinicella sp.]|jgi:type IV secretion system protein VirB10
MAGTDASVDPRIALPPQPEAAEAGVRPLVAVRGSGLPPALLWGAMILAGIILFVILDSRRRAQQGAVAEPAVAAAMPAAPPLYIPPTLPPAQAVTVAPPLQQYVLGGQPQARPRPRGEAPVPAQPPQTTIRYDPQPMPPGGGFVPPPQQPPPSQRVSNGPIVVIDTSTPAPAAAQGTGGTGGSTSEQSIGEALGTAQPVSRVRSSVFANRSTTVEQGALIPAVLETAFDSRRPGFARAIVSRDVRSFDGTRVLIPRGSRLTGEYRSDIQPGQKRALINWTRLVRPDGVTIAISSPSADTLGRGGVRGSYNSHFFQNFAGAVLQTVIQTGASLATRATRGDVIVALPGSVQQQLPTAATENGKIVPTLTIAAGTSISVFVARDLDFSAAEKAR